MYSTSSLPVLCALMLVLVVPSWATETNTLFRATSDECSDLAPSYEEPCTSIKLAGKELNRMAASKNSANHTEKLIKLRIQAASEGSGKTMMSLGLMYINKNNYGLSSMSAEEAHKNALYWYRSAIEHVSSAAKKGHPAAQYILGQSIVHLSTITNEYELNEGINWLKYSAKQGNRKADSELSRVCSSFGKTEASCF